MPAITANRRQSVLTAEDTAFKVFSNDVSEEEEVVANEVPEPLQTSSRIEVRARHPELRPYDGNKGGFGMESRSRPSSRRGQKPENKLLSYSLSVMGERPLAATSVEVAAAPEGDWTLYRPQEPGNSPIYIAASSEDEQTDIKGESAAKATTSRPPPRGEPPRRRRPSEAASSRWRPSRPDFVSSYDPFNQHVAPEAAAGPFGSRPYFSQRAEDEPRSSSFYFPL